MTSWKISIFNRKYIFKLHSCWIFVLSFVSFRFFVWFLGWFLHDLFWNGSEHIPGFLKPRQPRLPVSTIENIKQPIFGWRWLLNSKNWDHFFLSLWRMSTSRVLSFFVYISIKRSFPKLWTRFQKKWGFHLNRVVSFRGIFIIFFWNLYKSIPQHETEWVSPHELGQALRYLNSRPLQETHQLWGHGRKHLHLRGSTTIAKARKWLGPGLSRCIFLLKMGDIPACYVSSPEVCAAFARDAHADVGAPYLTRCDLADLCGSIP